MLISQFKKTNISEFPEQLSIAINRYTQHTSIVNSGFVEADLIHCHNRIMGEYKNKPRIIQYHSDVDLTDTNLGIPSLVVLRNKALQICNQ